MKALLQQALVTNHLKLSDAQQNQLLHFLELLIKWNKIFNLTRIINPKEMIYLHLVDSLSIADFLTGHYFLDVGSGAGLPGIPLAILHPKQQWVLLDKNNKKTHFLTQVVAELKLTNVKIIKNRVEALELHIAPDFLKPFDTIVSRAFSKMGLFIKSTQHLLAQKGILLAMKGKYPEEELAELPATYTTEIKSIGIRGVEVERHVVILRRNNTMLYQSPGISSEDS